MEKTSDTIIDELFNSFDQKVVPCIPESENTSSHSMAESIKKRKRHEKSKKHKKHKKKSKKSKKKHSSRSNSPDGCIKLKLKKDKLEEVKSGMPVTLDVVMETIVTTANETSEKFKENNCDESKNNRREKSVEIKVPLPDNDTNQTKSNGKIIIKDLKESRIYHKLINEVQEKERLSAEKTEDKEHSCSLHDLDRKKKKEKHKLKKKKRSRSRNRSRSSTPTQHKKRRRSHSHNSRTRYSRHDDFKNRQSTSKDHNDSKIKCRNKDVDNISKDKSNHHKTSVTPVKDEKHSKRSRSKDTKNSKRSEDYNRTKRRSRSPETNRARHRSSSCEKIDKKKLFKIARKNALSLVQQGVLPVGSVKKDASANLPTKTVDELTDFCRKLSKKDKDRDGDTSFSSSDEESKQPFHHPFLVKERPNIVMNIRNATQLPTKSFQEKTIGQDVLRQQFPVSSGQIHSLAVNEWVPLGAEESAKLNKIPRPEESTKLPSKSVNQQAAKVTESVVQPVSSPINAVVPVDYQFKTPVSEPAPFANVYAHNNYSLLSYETGQFTGHTGAKVLTPAELSAGYQPWVTKAVLLVFNVFKRYTNNTAIERRFVC